MWRVGSRSSGLRAYRQCYRLLRRSSRGAMALFGYPLRDCPSGGSVSLPFCVLSLPLFALHGFPSLFLTFLLLCVASLSGCGTGDCAFYLVVPFLCPSGSSRSPSVLVTSFPPRFSRFSFFALHAPSRSSVFAPHVPLFSSTSCSLLVLNH